ncbi:MAG TPA: hypothetical protein VF860_13595 [Candidatus Acidoferrales bacterium]
MTKKKARLCRIRTKPKYEKLPWPGLKAKDYLSRVITRVVKEAKETRENEVWAKDLIARVLDYVPPETALKLVYCEMRRRTKPIPQFGHTSDSGCEPRE